MIHETLSKWRLTVTWQRPSLTELQGTFRSNKMLNFYAHWAVMELLSCDSICIRKVCCDCGHVFVLRRTTRISKKSRKFEKQAVRALEAEIDAWNCRKHAKEQIVATRDNETGERKLSVEIYQLLFPYCILT